MNYTPYGRRQILKAGVVLGGLFAPSPWAWVWAQSEGTLKLLKAPKVALVVGNGAYKDAPVLKNAPNDAKAISEVLKASGFAVTMLLDTGREALVKAIRDYVNGMEKQKAVGLFYFAGHGVQLDWRNYMLPVDAVIDTVEDVGKQSVDVARLMEGLTKAANPMNVIILDACREDPFGKAKKPAQKGLSQMDAPTQTILAYATSPGNVASDGDGVNGLYTENLLREMKVPEAKIEDVFKRVRLGVRRKTNGAQIPWESTSLEEDFWFIPPKELKKLSDAEKDRLFREESKEWADAKLAGNVSALENYLRRYPNGDFAELAQLQLDRLLTKQGETKLEIAPSAGNPYTKGSTTANIGYKVGDSYVFRTLNLQTGSETGRMTQTVERITEDEVIFSGGFITDLLGNTRRGADGTKFTDSQNMPLEFAVGRHWTSRYSESGPRGDFFNEVTYRIVGREPLTLPSGTFNAYRIEGQGYGRGPRAEFELKLTNWIDPEKVRQTLVREQTARVRQQVVLARRIELISFQQG